MRCNRTGIKFNANREKPRKCNNGDNESLRELPMNTNKT